MKTIAILMLICSYGSDKCENIPREYPTMQACQTEVMNRLASGDLSLNDGAMCIPSQKQE